MHTLLTVLRVFTPVLAKHTKHLSLVDVFSIGVDRIQRNFEPMKKQVEAWKATRIPDEAAKLVIYRAFVESELDWMFPNISPAAFMIFISIHRSKNSLRGRHGVSPMPSRAHSKSLTRSRSSEQPRSWHHSSKWPQPHAIDRIKAGQSS